METYTKHIYIGSQRIVSKLGDLDSYGSDPRRIEYAGANVDGSKIDYKAKYQKSQQVIKDNYANFEVPYYGKDNDDYVNGQGFCCDDNVKKTLKFGVGNDNAELYQYYYHSDHLGSSSLITNLDGEIVQHIEYVPFGEVFIEERNNTWNTPYLFNAKELDEETGLYYYGARYYDPRTSIFLSVDQLVEQTGTPYQYCYQNPVRFIDPTGMLAGDIFDESGVWRGTDGKNDNKEYFAKGKTLKKVDEATMKGEYYKGSLAKSDELVEKPDQNTRNAVAVDLASTTADDREHGGHQLVDNTITHWDRGGEATLRNNGNEVGASITPFKVNGSRSIPPMANLKNYWHIHPETEVEGTKLGYSTPSPADKNWQKEMESHGYIGNAFIVGERNSKVQFYSGKTSTIGVSWNTFLNAGQRTGKYYTQFNQIRESKAQARMFTEIHFFQTGRQSPLP